MPAEPLASLDANESVAQHPFAETRHNERDFAGLEQARLALATLLAQPNATPYSASGRAVHCVKPETDDHRIVLYHPDAIRTAASLGAVGFCGFRADNLPDSIVAEINHLDNLLLDELLQYPDVLSYSTLRMPDANYVNLVLLRDLAAIDVWRGSPVHRHAAEVVSPRFYKHVRLHNGVLPQGIASAFAPTSTKYYDFESEPAWRALRSHTG